MIEVVLCVAYAVFYGLCLYLALIALEWLLAKIPGLGPLPAEAKPILQAMIAVAIFIMLVLCIFSGGVHRWDIFHLHSSP